MFPLILIALAAAAYATAKKKPSDGGAAAPAGDTSQPMTVTTGTVSAAGTTVTTAGKPSATTQKKMGDVGSPVAFKGAKEKAIIEALNEGLRQGMTNKDIQLLAAEIADFQQGKLSAAYFAEKAFYYLNQGYGPGNKTYAKIASILATT